MSDDELVAGAKSGDPEAWRELYREHHARLVLWLNTRPSGDAAASPEDVAAEAWLIAAAKVHGFTGSSSDFAGWIFGIARNVASNARRRSWRRRTAPSAQPAESAGDPTLDPSWGVEQQARIDETLSVLSPRERDVISCLEVVGLDVSLTARALGMSEAAVRVARHRGLSRLRSIPARSPDAGGHVRR